MLSDHYESSARAGALCPSWVKPVNLRLSKSAEGRVSKDAGGPSEVLIWIFPEIVWNRASDSSPHGIPKKFRCGHWTKSYRAIDDQSLVVFFDKIEAFQLVTLNFSLPSQQGSSVV